MMSVPIPHSEEAARLLQQALGTAGRVVTLEHFANGQGVEIFREAAPSIPLRLRPWHPQAEAAPDVVWILEKPTPRQVDELRERGLNFIALNGSVRVVSRGLILDRSNLPRIRSSTPVPRRVDPFADRNSLIARVLLDEPGRRWGVREIAEAAALSPGTASLVIKALAAMGVVDFHRRGRGAEVWIEHPEPLIRRWAGAYSWERNHTAVFAAPIGDPMRFLHRARNAFSARRWGLTLQAGASLVAPHASWERVHAYVDVRDARELHDIAHAEGWPAAADGGLVLLKPHYRHSVWHGLRKFHDLPVVSDAQLVLDLWHYPLRGMEQAEHLLTTSGLRNR